MSKRSQAANWLSKLFHPFIVASLSLFLILWLSNLTILESVRWSLLSILIVIVPAALFILVQIKRNSYSDFDVSIRDQRYKLYILGVGSFGVLIVVAIQANAPTILFACLYAATLVTLISTLINKFFTKISVHSMALAGVATVMGFISPFNAVISWLVWAIVGWARVYLGKHTINQIVLGCVVAIASVWLVFGFYF